MPCAEQAVPGEAAGEGFNSPSPQYRKTHSSIATKFQHSSLGALVLFLTRTGLIFTVAWKGHDQDLEVVLYLLLELQGAGKGALLGEG